MTVPITNVNYSPSDLNPKEPGRGRVSISVSGNIVDVSGNVVDNCVNVSLVFPLSVKHWRR